MSITYDKYYLTNNLFGDAYPELIAYFSQLPNPGKVLDLGCGQGRNAIPLARLGFVVTGIDHSKVGIEQMNSVATSENLTLQGMVADIFEYEPYEIFDFILLDSMFHFLKKDRMKEVDLIVKIVSKAKKGCQIVVCIQDQSKKMDTLNRALDLGRPLNRLTDRHFIYTFSDPTIAHNSKTPYRMIAVEK